MLGWSREKKETHEPERMPPAPGGHVSPQPASPPPSPVPTKTLEDLLLETGTISAGQLEKAKDKQSREGGFLGQILVDMHCIEDDSLTSFLAKHCRIPHLSLLDYLIDDTMLKLVPKEICLKYCLLPIDRLGRNLTIAMVNPLDAKALEAVQKACPELRIKPILCAYNHYQVVSRKLFSPEAKKTSDISMTSLGLRMAMPKTAPPPEAEPKPQPKPAPIPPPPSPPPAAEVVVTPVLKSPLDSDTLLETIFSQTPQGSKPAPAVETPAPSSLPSTNTESTMILREMISVMQDSMHDTYAVLARRMDLFHGLAAGDVARIFAKGVTREFEAGEVVFRKGDAGVELYVVLSGKVEIQDNDCVLAVLDKGDMFGEMAMGGHQTRSASAVIADRASMLVLSNDIIHNALGKEAAIQILENIVMTLSARLRAANERASRAESVVR
jgi:CRP-like cAMP-binding protein